MKNMNLMDLLTNKINALYDIENALVKALPKMAKAATDPDLKSGFTEHLAETKNQVQRLEKIGALMGTPVKKLKSEAIHGLVEDGEWVIKNVKPATALDAALARAAQGVEHFEIAEYEGAISWADELDKGEVASLLRESLAEEQNANEKLNEGGSKIQKELM